MTGTNSFQLKKNEKLLVLLIVILRLFLISISPTILLSERKIYPKKYVFFSGNILPKNHALY